MHRQNRACKGYISNLISTFFLIRDILLHATQQVYRETALWTKKKRCREMVTIRQVPMHDKPAFMDLLQPIKVKKSQGKQLPESKLGVLEWLW